MHSDPFVFTQFAPPSVPPGLVERRRLSRLLRCGLAHPVTLVCAPAGSGKTSLLASALGENPPMPVGWLSLEPGDDAPERFQRGVLTALCGAAPDASTLARLEPETTDWFGPSLVNTLAELSERIALVIDDAHQLRSRESLRQLAFLISHAPPTFAVVLSTRSELALGLHAVRVRTGLIEIRAHDLAFTGEEATQLFEAHEVKVAAPLVSTLRTRTEGWAAGLKLAALSLQRKAEPKRFGATVAGDDLTFDYLVAEVLERQPARLRTFLLKTSILERVNGDLADVITGSHHGADTLTELERTNGFVLGLDDRRDWFRYHRLLTAMLQKRAESELGDELIDLHRRAALWHRNRGMSSEALRHALSATDIDLGLEIIRSSWVELLAHGRSHDVRSLLERAPSHGLTPEQTAILGCATLALGDRDAGAAYLARATAAVERFDGPERRRLIATLAFGELHDARLAGDFKRADLVARDMATHTDVQRRALVHACLGETALWTRHLERAAEDLRCAIALAHEGGLVHLQASALSQLALRDALAEETPASRRHAQEAISLAENHGWHDGPQPAPAHLALAYAALSEFRHTEAAHHLQQATVSSKAIHDRGFQLLLVQAQAELLALRSPAEGHAMLNRFALSAPKAPSEVERSTLASLRARLHAAGGDPDTAWRELDTAGPSLATDLVRARLLLAAGDPDAAIEALEDATGPALLGRDHVERAVLLAVARELAGEPERAASAFEQALALAAPTGHRWAFLTVGAGAELLLRDRIRRGTAHRAYVRELMDALTDPSRERRAITPPLEPLTSREEMVLRYLPTTLANNEIAAELFISTNTVKTHLRSIYRKLGVERRHEAVARARDLQLLTTSRPAAS